MSVYMYAYEVQCEDDCVNCFYPTVNKFIGRDNKDLLNCIVLYCICLPKIKSNQNRTPNTHGIKPDLFQCILLWSNTERNREEGKRGCYQIILKGDTPLQYDCLCDVGMAGCDWWNGLSSGDNTVV